ncbi:MAG: site-specific DNA-methyltransferase, partial [Planctomycetaceae bacterium]|nr:site-specific DNA-methyltransferase [Planctomycetaceae bacterium]
YSAVEGYDDEGGASRMFYVAKASKSEREATDHPAVKPLKLCQHLAGLILPPKRSKARRLLVPYSGSGSEMIGALKASWDHVHGIEKDEAYQKKSLERLADHTQDEEKEDVPTAALPPEPPLQINTVVQGDCAKMIPRLPDKSVNLALCSPPYPDKRGDKYPTVSERDYPAWSARWMETLKTKLTNDGSVLIVIDKHVKKGVMSDFLLRTQLCLRERGWKQHMTQIWFKQDGLPLGHKWWPHHCYEEILWFSRTTHPFCDPWAAGSPSTNLAVRNYDQSEWTNGEKSEKEGIARMRDVLVVPVGGNAKGVDHPAKYPQALCESLIKTFSPDGGTVLDCFAGSGTTLLAAKATGRNFYGADVMKKYVDLARLRLDENGSSAA